MNWKLFLVKHARHFAMLALVLTIGLITIAMTGCAAPTWLTDANQIIGLVGTSIASVGSFIAALTGNTVLAAGLTTVSSWITKIQTWL